MADKPLGKLPVGMTVRHPDKATRFSVERWRRENPEAAAAAWESPLPIGMPSAATHAKGGVVAGGYPKRNYRKR